MLEEVKHSEIVMEEEDIDILGGIDMNEKFKQILNEINPEILEVEGVDLVEEGILDSLLIMMLVSKLEKEYSIYCDPDEITLENFASAEAIWNVVKAHTTNM